MMESSEEGKALCLTNNGYGSTDLRLDISTEITKFK
jgi:hypothetical protein